MRSSILGRRSARSGCSWAWNAMPSTPGPMRFVMRRCFTGVDLTLECKSKLVAIDEEPNHQIVHGRRFRKANRATHQTFDAGPEVNVFAFDLLRVLFANRMLRRIEMPLVGPPPIRVKPCDPKGCQQVLELEKDRILASPKDVGQHGPTVMINGMPEPPRLRFLADITPHLIEF